MFIIYAIISKTTGKIYIGQTKNLEERLKRHNQMLPSKTTSYTKINKGPWEVIYTEKAINRSEAIKREKQLKTARGRLFIKKLISTP